MTKYTLLALSIFLAVNISACGRSERSEDKPAAVIGGVRMDFIRQTTIDDVFEAPGVVRSVTSTTIAPQVMGNIIAVHVREGQAVKAGQLLVEIDDRNAQAQLRKATAGSNEIDSAAEEIARSIDAASSARDAAEVQRQLASTTVDRYKTLLERRSVSPQEFDEVQARFKSATAEVARAEQQLLSLEARSKQIQSKGVQASADVVSAQVQSAYARLVSPLDGIVTAKSAEVGMLATPGVPIVTVEAARYELDLSVEEGRIPLLHVGDRMQVRIDALGGVAQDSRITEITPISEPSSRSFTVKAALLADPRLRSGLFGAGLLNAGPRQVLLVPRSSIVQHGQLISVYVVDGADIARMRIIQTGKVVGDSIEVLSGLNDGERIVTEGIEKISDGVTVRS